jgi:hypothetical protein
MTDPPGYVSPHSPNARARIRSFLTSDAGAGKRELPPALLFL